MGPSLPNMIYPHLGKEALAFPQWEVDFYFCSVLKNVKIVLIFNKRKSITEQKQFASTSFIVKNAEVKLSQIGP